MLLKKSIEETIKNQKSYTDKIHACLLITIYSTEPNGANSGIKNDDLPKEIKASIEEIYNKLSDQNFDTNEKLEIQIQKIIQNLEKNSNSKLLFNNLKKIPTLENSEKNLKRFEKSNVVNKDLNSLIETKDSKNNFIEIFESPGGQSKNSSSIIFKKINKSKELRKNSNSGLDKHFTPWLLKKSSKSEAIQQTSLEIIFDSNENQKNQTISKIRKNKSENNKNRFYEENLIKFFNNSFNLGYHDEVTKTPKEKLIFSDRCFDQSLDNILFASLHHEDLMSHNIMCEIFEDGIVLKPIDFEGMSICKKYESNFLSKLNKILVRERDEHLFVYDTELVRKKKLKQIDALIAIQESIKKKFEEKITHTKIYESCLRIRKKLFNLDEEKIKQIRILDKESIEEKINPYSNWMKDGNFIIDKDGGQNLLETLKVRFCKTCKVFCEKENFFTEEEKKFLLELNEQKKYLPEDYIDETHSETQNQTNANNPNHLKKTQLIAPVIFVTSAILGILTHLLEKNSKISQKTSNIAKIFFGVICLFSAIASIACYKFKNPPNTNLDLSAANEKNNNSILRTI